MKNAIAMSRDKTVRRRLGPAATLALIGLACIASGYAVSWIIFEIYPEARDLSETSAEGYLVGIAAGVVILIGAAAVGVSALRGLAALFGAPIGTPRQAAPDRRHLS
jgi:hypothetical protein